MEIIPLDLCHQIMFGRRGISDYLHPTFSMPCKKTFVLTVLLFTDIPLQMPATLRVPQLGLPRVSILAWHSIVTLPVKIFFFLNFSTSTWLKESVLPIRCFMVWYITCTLDGWYLVDSRPSDVHFLLVDPPPTMVFADGIMKAESKKLPLNEDDTGCTGAVPQ